MTELEKYRRLAATLAEDKAQRGHEEIADFYFHQLQRLQIDLLLADIEVSEQQRQISAIEAKIGIVREEQRRNEAENRQLIESSSEQVLGGFLCPLKDCGKRFQKQSGLRLHHRLVHTVSDEWQQGTVFLLSLEESEW